MQAWILRGDPELDRAALSLFQMKRDTDLPDPLAMQDFRTRRPILAELARRRVADDRYFGRPRVFGYPKRSGSRRLMTQLDPIDELIYHGLVGRLIASIEQALSPEVAAVRCGGSPEAWVRRPWRPEHKTHRAAIEAARLSRNFVGFGRIDTASHYATIDLDRLASTLRSIGCPELAVSDLLEAISRLHEVPGHPKGLPVGPDGSGPLGTVALLPVDRVVALLTTWWRRWVDDYTIGLSELEAFGEIRQLVQAQHVCLGQKINIEKSVCEHFGTAAEPEEEDVDLVVEESQGAGAPPADSGDGGDRAQQLRDLAEAGVVDGMSYLLGGLGRDRDTAGVQVLVDHPFIFERMPKEVAKYLLQLEGHGIDLDWLCGLALAPTSLDAAAGQLWALEVLMDLEVPESVGDQMFSKALGLSRQQYAPLVNHLVAAAGVSREPGAVRRKRALEFVEALDDLNGERAGLAAFAGGSPPRAAKRGLDHLARCKPELRATVLWAAA